MPTITIKHRWDERLLYKCEAENFRAAIVRAVRENANLRGAVLTGAALDLIRADVIVSILGLPDEIPFLRRALVAGEIDGSTYRGKCTCLAGTMAHACGVPFEVFRDSGRMPIDSGSLRERWFTALQPSDTSETSAVARITLGWIDEALALVALIRGWPAVPTEASP